MTDSDSLRGDIDRHTHLPQCCGELETLRALLRPRMADAGDPTPTEALRGMFIEIERLRATTSESTRCQAIEDQLANAIEDRTVAKHALQSLRGRLHELLQLSMDGASDRDIFERIESLKVKLAEERKRTNMLAEQATAERRLASAAAEGHDHARALLVEIAEVFGRVDDFDAIPKMVKDLDDARRAALAKVERLQDRVDEQDKERVIRAAETAAERKRIEGELAIGAEKRDVAAARWTKICEAFGLDPEQDPPVSIPAILAAALRARLSTADQTGRGGVRELRRALADWLDPPPACAHCGRLLSPDLLAANPAGLPCPTRIAATALLGAVNAPPPGLLSWDGWVEVLPDGRHVWGDKAAKVGGGNPLTCDPSYARWVASLPSSPTGENGKAWCSDATRAALAAGK